MYGASSYPSTYQAEIAYRRDRAKASMGRRTTRRRSRGETTLVAGAQNGSTR